MRKGQAAMEFLMTYGWAILVVLAAIGALAYFGVLSPDRFLPSKCTASPPFACTEYKVTPTGVTLTLQNNGGTDLSSVDVLLTCGTTDSTTDQTAQALANGQGWTMTFTAPGACNPAVGQRFKGNFSIVYTESGASLNHTATGTIQARSE